MSNVALFPSPRPQQRNSNGVISLRDMLTFYAGDFCRIAGVMTQIYSQVQAGKMPTPDSWGVAAQDLRTLRDHSVELGFASVVAQIDRINAYVNQGPNLQLAEMGRNILEVHTRLIDELDARKVYTVPAERASYLSSNRFAPAVSDRFPDAIADMDEAARCYAFERPTACVFHLMRVTEFAVRAIADLLNINDHNPTWNPVIAKIDAELKADYKDRQYKGSQEFLANMSSHLHAVKVAWRNRTMHVEKVHTMEQAKEIYDATCGFMRYLGENMPAKKLGLVQTIKAKLGG